jgi:hypothetical protein
MMSIYRCAKAPPEPAAPLDITLNPREVATVLFYPDKNTTTLCIQKTTGSKIEKLLEFKSGEEIILRYKRP